MIKFQTMFKETLGYIEVLKRHKLIALTHSFAACRMNIVVLGFVATKLRHGALQRLPPTGSFS